MTIKKLSLGVLVVLLALGGASMAFADTNTVNQTVTLTIDTIRVVGLSSETASIHITNPTDVEAGAAIPFKLSTDAGNLQYTANTDSVVMASITGGNATALATANAILQVQIGGDAETTALSATPQTAFTVTVATASFGNPSIVYKLTPVQGAITSGVGTLAATGITVTYTIQAP